MWMNGNKVIYADGDNLHKLDRIDKSNPLPSLGEEYEVDKCVYHPCGFYQVYIKGFDYLTNTGDRVSFFADRFVRPDMNVVSEILS